MGVANGFDIVSGGTDNHLLLIDLRSKGVSGGKGETMCEFCNLVLNKNTIPTDKSAMNPNGLRVGAPAMTSRGFVEEDFVKVGEFLARAMDVAKEVQELAGSKKLVDFKRFLDESPPASATNPRQRLRVLRAVLTQLATELATLE